ncbi:Uncharacterised protein [uncultured archaeon]|nr:Uncharacterised protein [uncultured archaeon]
MSMPLLPIIFSNFFLSPRFFLNPLTRLAIFSNCDSSSRTSSGFTPAPFATLSMRPFCFLRHSALSLSYFVIEEIIASYFLSLFSDVFIMSAGMSCMPIMPKTDDNGPILRAALSCE